jgi:hypothetical protein
MSFTSRHEAMDASIAKRNPRKGHTQLGTTRHISCLARYASRKNDGYANYREIS